MVGWGYKLLGMPYHIVLWLVKNIYKVLKEALNYTAKGVELIIGLVLKTVNTLWKVVKAPLPWGWKQIKKIKPIKVINPENLIFRNSQNEIEETNKRKYTRILSGT